MGHIRPGKSPWGALQLQVSLLKKTQGTYRMCIDYSHLNRVSEQILHVTDLSMVRLFLSHGA